MVETFFLESTLCPRCLGGLTSKAGQLNCGQCHIRFPELDGIPWLFAHPDAVLADWRNRVQFQLQSMLSEVSQAETAAAKASSTTARQRLTLLAQGLKANLKILADLLKPIAVQGTASVNLLQAVKSQLPLTQRLMGYYTNLHRDWSWGEAEHQATNSMIDRLAGGRSQWGKVLVLGAGAGRFAYEIAKNQTDPVVALDINPLLAIFGRRMTSGETLKYYEFPVAPMSAKRVAVEGECRAPQGPRENVLWLLADGMSPPFKAQTFDTVITPWFIDVIPQDLNPMADQINHVLKMGGQWLNFGPFGFLGSPVAGQYSLEEVQEAVGDHGFSLGPWELTNLPYLHSPHSAQRRDEKVLNFIAKKVGDQPRPPSFRHYPEWLESPTVAIPKAGRLMNYAFATEVQFQTLSLIDGQRTMAEIAKIFAEKHQLSEEDSLGAVVTLIRQLWDGA